MAECRNFFISVEPLLLKPVYHTMSHYAKFPSKYVTKNYSTCNCLNTCNTGHRIESNGLNIKYNIYKLLPRTSNIGS